MSKAPDKIYVDTEIIAFYDLELKGKEDTEYIRKDALLEWVRTELKSYENQEELIGEKLAFTEVCEKINRM